MARCKGCRRRIPFGERRGYCAPRCFVVNGAPAPRVNAVNVVKPLKKDREGSFFS